jgi:hypothetical protein
VVCCPIPDRTPSMRALHPWFQIRTPPAKGALAGCRTEC